MESKTSINYFNLNANYLTIFDSIGNSENKDQVHEIYSNRLMTVDEGNFNMNNEIHSQKKSRSVAFNTNVKSKTSAIISTDNLDINNVKDFPLRSKRTSSIKSKTYKTMTFKKNKTSTTSTFNEQLPEAEVKTTQKSKSRRNSIIESAAYCHVKQKKLKLIEKLKDKKRNYELMRLQLERDQLKKELPKSSNSKVNDMITKKMFNINKKIIDIVKSNDHNEEVFITKAMRRQSRLSQNSLNKTLLKQYNESIDSEEEDDDRNLTKLNKSFDKKLKIGKIIYEMEILNQREELEKVNNKKFKQAPKELKKIEAFKFLRDFDKTVKKQYTPSSYIYQSNLFCKSYKPKGYKKDNNDEILVDKLLIENVGERIRLRNLKNKQKKNKREINNKQSSNSRQSQASSSNDSLTKNNIIHNHNAKNSIVIENERKDFINNLDGAVTRLTSQKYDITDKYQKPNKKDNNFRPITPNSLKNSIKFNTNKQFNYRPTSSTLVTQKYLKTAREHETKNIDSSNNVISSKQKSSKNTIKESNLISKKSNFYLTEKNINEKENTKENTKEDELDKQQNDVWFDIVKGFSKIRNKITVLASDKNKIERQIKTTKFEKERRELKINNEKHENEIKNLATQLYKDEDSYKIKKSSLTNDINKQFMQFYHLLDNQSKDILNKIKRDERYYDRLMNTEINEYISPYDRRLDMLKFNKDIKTLAFKSMNMISQRNILYDKDMIDKLKEAEEKNHWSFTEYFLFQIQKHKKLEKAALGLRKK